MESPGGGSVTLRYNLIEQAGQGVGSHGDFLQVFTGAPVTATILYNTTLQFMGFTQGFMLEPDGGPGAGIITSADVGNNTMLARGNGTQYLFTGSHCCGYCQHSTSVHDNYFAGRLAPGGRSAGGP